MWGLGSIPRLGGVLTERVVRSLRETWLVQVGAFALALTNPSSDCLSSYSFPSLVSVFFSLSLYSRPVWLLPARSRRPAPALMTTACVFKNPSKGLSVSWVNF